MAELDELLAEALRDLAAEAPGLPPLTSRSRRRIRAGRTGAILASVLIVAALCAGLVWWIQYGRGPEQRQPGPG